MDQSSPDLRLTVARVIVRFLPNRFIGIDGGRVHSCPGGFGSFGSFCQGNAPMPDEAINDVHNMWTERRRPAWRQVDAAETSPRPQIAAARAPIGSGRSDQRRGM